MSTRRITDWAQFEGLPPGTVITITENALNPWVKTERGDWRASDGTLLRESYFRGAVAGDYVQAQGEGGPAPGTWFRDASYYYVVVACLHGQVEYARVTSSGQVSDTVTAPSDPPGSVLNGQEYTWMPSIYEGQSARRKVRIYEELLEKYRSGEAPDMVTYDVRVKMKGEANVVPSNDMVIALMGDTDGLSIGSVGAAAVKWTRDVIQQRNSDTGCACEMVSADSLETYPGMTDFSVLGCTVATEVDEELKTAG